MKYTKNNASPSEKRDPSADKRKIKKAVIIVAAVIAVLALLAAVLPLVLELVTPDYEDVSYDQWRFYEADYSKNIYEDKVYMSQSRSIKYTDQNTERVLTAENCADISSSAAFFYDYITCIIEGDYSSYPSFFTDAYINNKDIEIPEKFTMQGLYDIHIDLFSPATRKTVDGVELSSEVYEVSYRIFENNGTFRTDILPDETRTLVFELYIFDDGTVKINAIGFRTDAEEE